MHASLPWEASTSCGIVSKIPGVGEDLVLGVRGTKAGEEDGIPGIGEGVVNDDRGCRRACVVGRSGVATANEKEKESSNGDRRGVAIQKIHFHHLSQNIRAVLDAW